MHPNSRIPEPGTYNRVLRRYDRDPRYAHQQRFASYNVNLRAVAAEMDGQVAMTLFFPPGKETAAARATRVGWIDCTEAWMAMLAGPPVPSEFAKMLGGLPWNALIRYATGRGVDHKGKRPQVEARILAWHDAQAAG